MNLKLTNFSCDPWPKERSKFCLSIQQALSLTSQYAKLGIEHSDINLGKWTHAWSLFSSDSSANKNDLAAPITDTKYAFLT